MVGHRLSDFKLDHAICARRMTRFEARTFQEVGEFVYLPTNELLREHATKKPTMINCTASRAVTLFDAVSSGKRVNVHLILPDQTLIYLGMVLDHDLSVDLWEWLKKSSRHTPEILQRLQRTRPTAVRQTAWGVLIPTASQELTLPLLTDAIGRCLWHQVPELMEARPTIEWLNATNENLAAELESAIIEKARATANPRITTLTAEELAAKIIGESEDLFSDS